MTTLIGIDAATKPGNIGLARGLIHAGKVVVEEVRLGSEVESIAGTVGGWIKGLTIIAVDARWVGRRQWQRPCRAIAPAKR
jgi:hypothetical protein